MSSFIINTTNNKATYHFSKNWQNDKHDGSFTIRDSSPVPVIKVDNSFVSFISNSTSKNVFENYQMANKGVVNKVQTIPSNLNSKEIEINKRLIESGKNELKMYEHSYYFLEANPFTKNTFLDDYTYSLLKIYRRYLKPIKHFSFAVTKIENNDLETFENEEIYYERTLFGKLINSLPYHNRIEFILFSLNEFKTSNLNDIPISSSLPYLMDFVDSGVLTLGKYLVETKRILSNLDNLFSDINQVGFIEEEMLNKEQDSLVNMEDNNLASSNLIVPQANLFEDLFSLDFNIQSFNKIFKQKSNTESLARFTELFRKRGWPIDVTNDVL